MTSASVPVPVYGRWETADVPSDKSQFVPDTLTARQGKLKVVHGPTTLLLRQLADKGVIVLVGRLFQDDDGFLVVRQAVDDVGELLAGFELLVFLDAFGGLQAAGR